MLAMGLWAMTVGIVGWWFVTGSVMPGPEGRTQIILAPGERMVILGEMRQLLKSVHGVVSGLSDEDQATGRKAAAEAARAAGMAMAAEVPPALMLKLPLPFKQMGQSVHRDFDILADGIEQGESSQRILGRLSSITARCTTCHELYRLTERH